jgi:putative NIF3 family GTP cyclohydrolase 1 type 2
MALGDLAAQAAEVLRASGVRVGGRPGLVVQRIAVLPGSGAAFAESAIATGAEVLVTGDVSHHRAVAALDGGLAVIDVGHAPSERPGMAALLGWLREVDVAPVADLTTITTNPWEAP